VPDTLNQQYQALLEVSSTIAAHRDFQDLFHELSRCLHHVVQFDYLLLLLYDEKEHGMRLHVLETARTDIIRPPAPLRPEDSPGGVAWLLQQPVLIPDIDREERWPQIVGMLRTNGVRSSCYLPLTTAHRRVGSLGFGSRTPNIYSPHDIEFMQQVARQVAVAIENALNSEQVRSFQHQVQRERDRLKVLLDTTNALNSNLEGRQIFTTITDAVRHIIHQDFTAISLLTPQGDELEFYALDFVPKAGQVNEQDRIPLDRSPARVALAEGKPFRIDASNVQQFHAKVKSVFETEGIREAWVFPLITRNRKIGVLHVASRTGDVLSTDDVDFLSQIAGQTAIALDNMLAFQEIAELKDRLAEEKLYLEDEIRTEHNFAEMIGDSPRFRQILRQIETVAPTNASVLILGETGTGKELVARAIHELSTRRARTFVKLNCSAIPTGLLESELFGHERGAFTGAISQKLGRFELAHQGTLFLDEVGDIPLELQPKLLRALQEQEFERLGSTRTILVDARVVAATNRDLEKMIGEGQFRSDLFYRLNVFPIRVPPLRERREDIPTLVRYFTQRHSRLLNRHIESIASETMESLTRYDWPGNVRELENLIERAVILARGPLLRISGSELRQLEARAVTVAVGSGKTLEEAEREHIVQVLEETNWVVAGRQGAASRLGMKRTTLQSRMKKLGIRR
jgi:formate hydrogenlyase transcriptional activator